ncbi:MAG: HU family DNA-binding protein [Bacteroidales bacterium]
MIHKYGNKDFILAVKQVAEDNNIDIETAKNIVIDFLELVISGVGENRRFNITGFGLFYLKETAARTRYIPTSGNVQLCKSNKIITFKESPLLKKDKRRQSE